MAQSVERILGKDEVVSSILTSSSEKNLAAGGCEIFLSKPPGLACNQRACALYVITAQP